MMHAQIDGVPSAAHGVPYFDALHVPANRDAAGRGWCDAVALGDGRYAFAIGEITGDAAAAALMVGAFRETFAKPDAAAEVAASAAEGRFRPVPPPAALVGIVDHAGATLSYSSAGGPPPCIRYHDGSVALLPAAAAEDDAAGTQPAACVVVDLRDAALVLFYAEALVREEGAPQAGAHRVRAALEAARPEHWSRPAAALADALVGGRPHDDLALLAVAFPPRPVSQRTGAPPTAALPAGGQPRWTVTWSFDTTRVAATGVRRAFMACLTSKEAGARVDLDAAELIFGEMLGNVIRHAPGPVEIVLDWTGDLPLLHMLDDGPGFVSRRSRERLPSDDWSESGRGLFIINACAAAFKLQNRRDRRGTHACATLPAA